MNSRAQQARLNGAKSKGPITIDGKAKSSQNALKHGFAAQANILIAPDDSESWRAHLAGYRDSYRPVNYQESAFVDQLAAIAWRQSRLVAIETALIDFQIAVQKEDVDRLYPVEQGNPYLHLALAWQGLAAKASGPAKATPPDSLDIQSIELVRRYQVSLDRQFRSTLLNLRQDRKDFTAPAALAQVEAQVEEANPTTELPNQPKATPPEPARQTTAAPPNEPNSNVVSISPPATPLPYRPTRKPHETGFSNRLRPVSQRKVLSPSPPAR